jgi:hypothetical protein
MRGLLAGLVIAILVIVVALLGAALGAFGIAAIGWLLHRVFDLTQWQGSLIALAVATGLGYLVFRLAVVPLTPPVWTGDWDSWENADESAGQHEAEPPIVPWRRQRPTPGELPPQESDARRARRKRA